MKHIFRKRSLPQITSHRDLKPSVPSVNSMQRSSAILNCFSNCVTKPSIHINSYWFWPTSKANNNCCRFRCASSASCCACRSSCVRSSSQSANDACSSSHLTGEKCVSQQGPEAKRKNPNTQLWRVGEKIKSWSLMIMNPSFCVVPTHTCERLLKMWSKCFNTVGFSQFHGLWCFSYVCNATNRNHSHLWLITKWKSSPIPCQPNSTETLKRIAKNKSRHLEDNSCTFAADFSALFLRLVSTKNCLKKVESWKLPYLKFRCL